MNDVRGSSPTTSEALSDGMDSLSIRDKSLLKRSISKHHNNNFTAGYVPVNEQYLQKTGLRGRKTFAFWALIGLLFILAVGNLILTMTILGVLRLGQGMQSLELVPENSAIKLFGVTDLNHIYKRDGRMEGFQDYPVDITGDEGAIVAKLAQRNGKAYDKLTLNRSGIIIISNAFEVKNKKHNIFTTDSPSFNIVKPVENIQTKAMHTSRLVSPISSKLLFEGANFNLKGAEGTSMESSEIVISADQDISLKSLNGSIVLTGLNGVQVSTSKLPIFMPSTNSRINLQYKLCICMPQGKLFKIPVTKDDKTRVHCDRINISQFNPCI